nr:hypothetical protein [Tanacetum cinerariifolium]
MVDDVAAPSGGVEWDAPYRPSFGVLTKEVFKDPAIYKIIVDQFSTPRKMHLSRVNDNLATFDASFAKSKAKGKENKKKIKSLSKSLDNLHSEVARLSDALNQATILEAKKDEEILRLKVTPPNFLPFLGPIPNAGFERGLSMHQTKDEFAAVLKRWLISYLGYSYFSSYCKGVDHDTVSKSLELSANVVPASSAAALEQNKEQVSAVVDGSNLEMTDGAAHSKSGGVFMHGTSHVLDDVAEVTVVGSQRVSFDLTDVVVVLSTGEKGDGSAPSSTVEEGKGIMVDDVAAPSGGVSRQRPSFGPAPSFRDISGDAIHTDFFSFSPGPYYATYLEDGVAGNYELSQSHHEYVLSTDSRLKGYEEKSKAKGNESKKKIKSLSKSLDNLHSKVARLSDALNQATILEAKKDEDILLLKATPPKFSSFFRGQFQGVDHDTVSKSLELSANVVPASSAAALEQNKEQVSAVVDGSNLKMTDGAAHSKSGGAFVHGTSHVLDDVAEVTMVGSQRVSSDLTDVVVALSTGEKGDGSAPSSTVEEGRGAWYARKHLFPQAWGKLTVDMLLSIQRILSHATRPKPNGFPLGPLV